jgi:hypothetical protein
MAWTDSLRPEQKLAPQAATLRLPMSNVLVADDCDDPATARQVRAGNQALFPF